jgi:hypothetical protein
MNKFRCWDKDNLQMYYSDTKYEYILFDRKRKFFQEIVDNYDHVYVGHRNSITTPNQVSMECIGIKDCNNNLIYVGDILEIDFTGIYGELRTTNIIIKDAHEIDLYVINAEKLKIIGNIFENKED